MSRQAIAAVLARTDLASRERMVALTLASFAGRESRASPSDHGTFLFADVGPWWDGDINVEVFDAVLGCSPARGPERLLLATMAPIADQRGDVRELSTEQPCAAAASQTEPTTSSR